MRLIFLLLLIVVAIGCFSDPIDLELNKSNPKLSITAWITDESTDQFVVVSKSTEYTGSKDIDYVRDAKVYLRSGQDEYELSMRDDDGPYFLPADWQAQMDAVYQLEVIVDGQSYIASDTMRVCPEIVAPGFVERTTSEDSVSMYEVHFAFTDTQGHGDGYYLIDYKKSETLKNFVNRGVALQDEYFDAQLIDSVSVTDVDFRYAKGDTSIIQIFSIGKSAVEFIEQVNNEAFKGESPFESIPVNVKTNFSNGAIGYFMIGAARSAEVIIN